MRHLAALLAAVALVLGALACSRVDDIPSAALPARSGANLGDVSDFHLTERSGKPIARADLAGRVWVASFVFTRCGGPCPKVTGHMRRLQDLLAGTHAQLVSFSVDPEHDTPEVLQAYAANIGADPARWWMLTGDRAQVDQLARAFLSTNQRTTDGSVPVGLSIAHQTRIGVVDGDGELRGLYSGETDEHLELIAARVRHLEEKPFDFALLNASLNACATVLLIAGLIAIKSGRRELHERLMYLAFFVSLAFLASYLWYHVRVIPERGITKYHGAGALKTVYYAMLASHVVLAAANVPLCVMTFLHARRAKSGREAWDKHRRWAKVTFPVWLYVSVTGVLVYFFLYVWNPPAATGGS